MPGRGLGAEIDRDLKLPQNVEITTAHHQDKLWLHSFGLWRGPTTAGLAIETFLFWLDDIWFYSLDWSRVMNMAVINNDDQWSGVLLRRLYIIYQSFLYMIVARHKVYRINRLLKHKGWISTVEVKPGVTGNRCTEGCELCPCCYE